MAIYSSSRGYEVGIIMISILQMRRLRLSRFHDFHEGKNLLYLHHFSPMPRSVSNTVNAQYIFVEGMSPTTMSSTKMVTSFHEVLQLICNNQPTNQSISIYTCDTHKYIFMEPVSVFPKNRLL